jgi:hypothetical protein
MDSTVQAPCHTHRIRAAVSAEYDVHVRTGETAGDPRQLVSISLALLAAETHA